MRKIIRPTYPKEFSIGILLLVFIISCFLAQQIFVVSIHDLKENTDVFLGIFLIGVAVVMMVLIMWEEILFPIKLKEVDGGIIFRNRVAKLRTQILMYLFIPLIFGFVYFTYEVNHVRFLLWLLGCMVPPVLDKIVSGIKNLHDFLQLTDDKIEYKNNEKEGHFNTTDIQYIEILSDDKSEAKKMQLTFKDNTSVCIDLDEMELDAYYNTIDKFVASHYKHLVKHV